MTLTSFTIFNPANLPKEEIESDEDTETETKSFEEYGFDHVKALSKRFGRANISENEILTEYENFKHSHECSLEKLQDTRNSP